MLYLLYLEPSFDFGSKTKQQKKVCELTCRRGGDPPWLPVSDWRHVLCGPDREVLKAVSWNSVGTLRLGLPSMLYLLNFRTSRGCIHVLRKEGNIMHFWKVGQVFFLYIWLTWSKSYAQYYWNKIPLLHQWNWWRKESYQYIEILNDV